MSLHILVVDDNRMLRGMVVRTVRMSGLAFATISEACDGAEALTLLGAGGIGLVLLDLNMPVMDGETLLTRIRADQVLRETMVVIVSSESSPVRLARLAALGAGFVHKPFRPEVLVAEVARLQARASLSTPPGGAA